MKESELRNTPRRNEEVAPRIVTDMDANISYTPYVVFAKNQIMSI